MSPAQIQGRSVDARPDIFSLGVLLREMLTGERLFKGDGPLASTESLLHDDPPSLRSRSKVIPQELKNIQRALAKDPDDDERGSRIVHAHGRQRQSLYGGTMAIRSKCPLE